MSKIYSLDSNALIEPWNKYYSIQLCPEYWEILDRLGKEGRIFCTEEVKREIEKVDDGLKSWLSKRPHLVKSISNEVQQKLREILVSFPNIISVGADRSMADPWVIAHAFVTNATVVSKEYAVPERQKDSRIKIPDVCRHFGVPCINDLQFVNEVGIKFSARLG